jgi:1-acyl-sn-glycerol-3-phosphate acyltransferase
MNDIANRKQLQESELTKFERLSLSLGRWTNERNGPKKAQDFYLRTVAYSWMRAALARRMFVEGFDELNALRPDAGVLIVSNHRSFFDQYALTVALWATQVHWARRVYFPVRANFFYDRPLGLCVNYLVGAGVMYPPIFRRSVGSGHNRDAIRFLAECLHKPDVVVGVHPEGQRNLGVDPYVLLPAQPGIGQIALLGRATVVPFFINGLSNDLLRDIRRNYAADIRRTEPLICVAGAPIDCEDLYDKSPRPALYKLAADRFRSEIMRLGEREKSLRRACSDGHIPDSHPGWLINRPHAMFYAAP